MDQIDDNDDDDDIFDFGEITKNNDDDDDDNDEDDDDNDIFDFPVEQQEEQKHERIDIDKIGVDEKNIVNIAPEPTDVFTFCIVKCKLCAETLKEPVSLPCGHNFCKECLHAQMANTSDDQHYSCRVCRASFVEYTKKNGIKCFKENYLLSGLLGLVKKVDNNDNLFDMFAASIAESQAMTQTSNTHEIKTYFNKLSSHTLVDSDFVILENQIKKLEHARRIGVLQSKALKIKLSEVIIKDVKEENLPKYIKSNLLNQALVDEAARRFCLPKDVYNLIVIQTDADDFKYQDRFIDNILSLPIRGIAAERSIIIIQCISQYLDVIINEVFDIFQITYEGVIATWIEDSSFESNNSKKKQVTSNNTHLFVGGTLGQVRAMREKHRGNKILEVRAPLFPTTIIPYKVFEQLAKLLSVYQNRCLILSGQSHIGTEREIYLPNGWDLAKQNVN